MPHNSLPIAQTKVKPLPLLVRAVLSGRAYAGMPTKMVGLLASSITLMALAGAGPLFFQPRHWVVWLVWAVGLLAEVLLAATALLTWRAYLRRVGAEY
jgi:hypothetical protein